MTMRKNSYPRHVRYFVQRLRLCDHCLPRIVTSQEHTSAQIWLRLLCQPQQLFLAHFDTRGLSVGLLSRSRPVSERTDALPSVLGDGPTAIHNIATVLFQARLAHQVFHRRLKDREVFQEASTKSSSPVAVVHNRGKSFWPSVQPTCPTTVCVNFQV